MVDAQAGYQSYLLRLWVQQREDKLVWRVALESVQDQGQWSFANLEDCFAFLQEQGKGSIGAHQVIDFQDEGDDPRLDTLS